MLRHVLVGSVAAACLVQSVRADDDKDKLKPEQIGAIAEKLAPSMVKVEIVAQYDKGEAPGSDASDRWSNYYRSVAAYASGESAVFTADNNWDELIREERPSERGGYLVSP